MILITNRIFNKIWPKIPYKLISSIPLMINNIKMQKNLLPNNLINKLYKSKLK
jgi:hypothetical protein